MIADELRRANEALVTLNRVQNDLKNFHTYFRKSAMVGMSTYNWTASLPTTVIEKAIEDYYESEIFRLKHILSDHGVLV